MPFIQGVGKVPDHLCFSVSDFHEYDYCPFRFFVNHHLKKKYELSEGNFNMTVGTLLDGAIKKFHRAKAYGQGVEFLSSILRAQFREMQQDIEKHNGVPSFNSAMKDFLTEEALNEAIRIFKDYYTALNGKVKYSLGEVDFCKIAILNGSGAYVLWGWPDAFELGEDGLPEIVDYKFREDVEKGKKNMDMDLMPKVYTLLASDYLKSKGYERARFVVRIWQDPLDSSLNEEFDLSLIDNFKDFFKQKIERILGTEEVKFCEQGWCKACSSERRQEFLRELQERGFIKVSDL